jgi:hypothetical protein
MVELEQRQSEDLPAGGLRLRTLGHASLVVYRAGERPLLLTDPWLLGSVYWRSWWLQHCPSREDIAWLGQAAHVYITHEHPDHFHTPSLRRLGGGPLYLLPDLAERGWGRYLGEHGYRVKVAPPLRWLSLGDGVSMLSIPLWNDDSLLLVDTPNALILNLNDAKPPPPIVRALRRLGDRIGKPRVLLCSYSPASLVNSFLDDRGIVSLRSRQDYVAYACRLCDRLAIDYYMPFASQAVFRREDSRWANAYRTTYDDLQRYWRAPARLLPPYATLDLGGFRFTAVSPEHYRSPDCRRVARRVEEREIEERATVLTAADLDLLQRKLNRFGRLIRILLPRGFAFRFGAQSLFYDPRRRALADCPGRARGDFVVEAPPATVRDALRHNHLSDLGITMFVRIRVLRPIDLRKAYGLFVLFQFDDYGHLAGLRPFLRWLGRGLRYSLVLRLPQPPRAR